MPMQSPQSARLLAGAFLLLASAAPSRAAEPLTLAAERPGGPCEAPSAGSAFGLLPLTETRPEGTGAAGCVVAITLAGLSDAGARRRGDRGSRSASASSRADPQDPGGGDRAHRLRRQAPHVLLPRRVARRPRSASTGGEPLAGGRRRGARGLTSTPSSSRRARRLPAESARAAGSWPPRRRPPRRSPRVLQALAVDARRHASSPCPRAVAPSPTPTRPAARRGSRAYWTARRLARPDSDDADARATARPLRCCASSTPRPSRRSCCCRTTRRARRASRSPAARSRRPPSRTSRPAPGATSSSRARPSSRSTSREARSPSSSRPPRGPAARRGPPSRSAPPGA